MKIAIYPGAFDPITTGHLDVLKRGVEFIDKIIISVGISSDKKNLFSIKERIEFIKKSISDIPSIEVDSFDGLMVEHAKKHSAVAAIRGLRVLSDFEFEFKMALMNRSLNEKINTVFLMPNSKYIHISSSMVKEVASLGGDVSDYVPSHVNDELIKKYK